MTRTIVWTACISKIFSYDEFHFCRSGKGELSSHKYRLTYANKTHVQNLSSIVSDTQRFGLERLTAQSRLWQSTLLTASPKVGGGSSSNLGNLERFRSRHLTAVVIPEFALETFGAKELILLLLFRGSRCRRTLSKLRNGGSTQVSAENSALGLV